ncbi:MAG: acyl-CoA thioesterase [Bacteroidales bacterium]|nr:acyl-CoA thioesterase [Bacteroidales bacterium]
MTYKHKIQYYETDKQGVTHHSNYIRIMEETRIFFMEEIGCGYERMEEVGIVSPVMNVNCDYKRPTTFPDIVEVELSVLELSKLKTRFGYKMTVGDKVVCTASSLHCFLDLNGRPVALEDRFPEFYKILVEMQQNAK